MTYKEGQQVIYLGYSDNYKATVQEDMDGWYVVRLETEESHHMHRRNIEVSPHRLLPFVGLLKELYEV